MSKPALREVKALDLPMTPFALAGLAIWALVGLGLLPFQSQLEAAGRGHWIWICVAGFIAGLPGLWQMRRHDRRRARNRAAGAAAPPAA